MHQQHIDGQTGILGLHPGQVLHQDRGCHACQIKPRQGQRINLCGVLDPAFILGILLDHHGHPQGMLETVMVPSVHHIDHCHLLLQAAGGR